jgi:hypothetical protein
MTRNRYVVGCRRKIEVKYPAVDHDARLLTIQEN